MCCALDLGQCEIELDEFAGGIVLLEIECKIDILLFLLLFVFWGGWVKQKERAEASC